VNPLGLERTSVIALITSGTVAGINVPDPRLFINAQRLVLCRASDVTAWSEALLADICPILSVEWITVYSNAGERWADDSFMIERAHEHA
jgi:hypothetical protein